MSPPVTETPGRPNDFDPDAAIAVNDRPTPPDDLHALDPAELTYRPWHGEAELSEVARLFDMAGWGPVELDWLRPWLLQGPLGPSLVMVIADDDRGELLGMNMLNPYRVQLGDRVSIGARGRAAILDPRLRRSARGVDSVDEGDPFHRLNLARREQMDARGWWFSYALPNPKMVRRGELRTFDDGLHRSRVELGAGLRVDIDGEGPRRSSLEVVPTEGHFGPEYDMLWQRARTSLGIECAVARDAQGLQHVRGEYVHGDQIRLECRLPNSGELLGFTEFHPHGDPKLADILAVDADALDAVMGSSVAWLRSHPDDHEMAFFTGVPHPAHREALRNVGGREVDWTFYFEISSHHELVGSEFEASRWYVTAGD